VNDWVRHAIWWQVYPLGFTGAERTALPEGAAPVPRLRQVEDWLPHLVELGCNGLALGPVFASETHGYDTVDHFRVDPRLGTEADLQRLLDACSARGVRVLLDGVFNHVGRGHPRFRQLLAEGPGSPAARWFHVQQDPHAPDGFRYRDFEGHSALVALNHDSPEVTQLVTDVMTTWCDRGVAAWRLDAAYAVPPRFWQRVLPAVRERHADLWVVGEVIHGDYAGYVEQSGIDSVTQYELWKAVWSSLEDRNLFELAHALRRHGEMVRRFLPQTFVGNHDVTRLASRLTDRRALPLAVAVLLTVPGVPTLYYGDEWALEGVKEDRAGGDDAVRPAFPRTPDDAGWAADPARAAVADLHRTLMGLRRRHPWLVDATLAEPDVLRNELLAVRLGGDGEQLALVLNLADAPAEVTLPLPGAHVLAGSGGVRPRGGGVVATVAGHDFLVVGR
jgi:cyclomaltodextrinase / maltogenic alpha-amylase / neopullulanase